jgi:hypothetical protein
MSNNYSQTFSTSAGDGGASYSSFSYSAGGSSGDAFQSFGSSSSGSASTGGGSVNQIAQDLLALQRSGGSGSQSFEASGSSGGSVLSQIEQAILRSTVPIDINETEEITVLGQRGIWANRSEVINWRGVIPITEYLINEDANPEVITKRSQQQLTYVQELAIRYLRPPTPPAPGEIVITQEASGITAPAPPIIIRQQPARPGTPEPLVIREAPPQPPAAIGRKVITIGGKRLPPPPRKVVIERLAPLPSKPQSVLVERWLPYSQVKRRVIFQRAAQRDAVAVKPRNIIVQWEAPQVDIKKEIKYLGVIRANPVEYVQRYGATLKTARELPQFVLDIKTPDGLVLAANHQYNSLHDLEGDLDALRLIDLDKEGLSEYREFLSKFNSSSGSRAGSQTGYTSASVSTGISNSLNASNLLSSNQASSIIQTNGSSSIHTINSASTGNVTPHASNTLIYSSGANTPEVVAEIFKSVDSDQSGTISVEEANNILMRLNSRLNRNYGEKDRLAFFAVLDTNKDGHIDLNEFKQAYSKLL